MVFWQKDLPPDLDRRSDWGKEPGSDPLKVNRKIDWSLGACLVHGLGWYCRYIEDLFGIWIEEKRLVPCEDPPLEDGLMDKIHQFQGASFGGITLDCFFTNLKRLLEKKAWLFWNNKYFHKYIEDKIVPWGLRIQIFPNLFKVESEFKHDWENHLQSCSFKMRFKPQIGKSIVDHLT